MTKRAAPPVSAAEYQQLLTENDQIRAELAELRHKLACHEQMRKDNISYMQELWNENRRLHAELKFFNQRELTKTRP